MSDVNVIVNSDKDVFDIYSELFEKDYRFLITTDKSKFLTDKTPKLIKGNYYFKDCSIHRISGLNISSDYIGGDVVEIEIKKDKSYLNVVGEFK